MSTLSEIKPKLVAITGSIGSGKSSVSRYLLEKGYLVFSADEIVSDLYQYDGELLKSLQNLTDAALIKENQIDKKVMSYLLFSDDEFKKQAEGLIHQRVYDMINEIIETHQYESVLFFEIPLLFETNQQHRFDEVIVVDINDKTRIERLIKYRKMTLDEIETRLKHQKSQQFKREYADIVFDNNSTLENLYQQVDYYLERMNHDLKTNESIT